MKEMKGRVRRMRIRAEPWMESLVVGISQPSYCSFFDTKGVFRALTLFVSGPACPAEILSSSCVTMSVCLCVTSGARLCACVPVCVFVCVRACVPACLRMQVCVSA